MSIGEGKNDLQEGFGNVITSKGNDIKNLGNRKGVMPIVSMTRARAKKLCEAFAIMVECTVKEMNEDQAKLKKTKLEGFEEEDPL